MNDKGDTDLVPFIEVDVLESSKQPSHYVFGTRDSDGRTHSVTRLAVEEVHDVVFDHVGLSVMCETSGELSAYPTNVSEAVIQKLVHSERLGEQPIDEVIETALQVAVNDSADEAVANLRRLDARLAKSRSIVKRALEVYGAASNGEATSAPVPDGSKKAKKDVQ